MNLIRSFVLAVLAGSGLSMAQFNGMMGFEAPSTISVSSAASVQSYQPGKPFYVALKGEITPPWHAYWQNPGTVGEPMSADIAVPAGFTVKGIDFSPIRGPEGNIEYLGYLSAVPGDNQFGDLKELVARSHGELEGES